MPMILVKTRKIVLTVGTIVIIIVISLLLRDLFASLLIIPAANLFELIKLVAINVPGRIWWLLVLLFLVGLFINFLTIQSFKFSSSRQSGTRYEMNRLNTWNKWIKEADRSEYARWQLVKNLSGMMEEVMDSDAWIESVMHDRLQTPMSDTNSEYLDDVVDLIMISQQARSFSEFSKDTDRDLRSRLKTRWREQVMESTKLLETRMFLGGKK
jgi:hypothetical protein